MSSVDERIVEMKFNNSEFERGVKTTLTSLDALKKSLQLDGATKGLSDVSDAAKKLSLAGLVDGVDNLASKFGALSIVAITALTNIANRAVDAGITLVKSLTIDPVKTGLDEYETKLNSIQTILANTQWQGTNLEMVNRALEELNRYSDQTIYNFGEMARNIGTFTAAGVKLDTSVAAIKGIANLAAISGSSSLQASTAMYQLSQALAAGRVALIDWNSVVNAGMGGKVFQDALMETARVHGVAIDSIIKKEGSFRESLKSGWLKSNILTETLSKFTGDLTAEQLKSMGYTQKQIAEILKMGKTAQEAATKVKTMSQLISTLQEAAGSGWAQTWQLIFGDFEEAKTMFTDVNNLFSGFINASAEARNKVVGDWKELGGRAAMIESISNVFHALISVITPIKDAFGEIFPPTTGKQLYDLTIAIRDFTRGLKMGADTAENIKRTFAGVFAVFGIGWEILKQVVRTFLSLFEGADKGAGSFLEVTASIGDFFVNLHRAVKSGDDLTRFFDHLGAIIKIPIKALESLGSILSGVFDPISNIDTSGLEKFAGRFESFGNLGPSLASIWDRVLSILSAVAEKFAPIVREFTTFFGRLGQSIRECFSSIDYNSLLDGINTGLMTGLLLLFRKFLNEGVGVSLKGGFVDSIKESFDMLTGTLKAMQTQIKANALIKIAGALALLTASVVALSMVDSAKLAVAITAMGGMFTELMTSMAVFEKIGASKGFAKMPFVTASMILLAIAIDTLSIAVVKLSKLDWEGLAKGLTGVIALIGSLGVAAKLISGNTKGLTLAGVGFILLAEAIKMLVSSVKDLSGMNWEDMAKGLTGIATLLGSLALFTKFSAVGKGGITQGLGIILLATGIKILTSAISDFSNMSWEEIGKGLAAVAGSLAPIAAALALIPPSSVISAAAVLAISFALGAIADAVIKMGNLSWENIGKGLAMLAGTLTAIGIAISLIPPSSILSASAIGMIADAISKMGNMNWENIGKGLASMAGGLTVMAAALALIPPSSLLSAAAVLVVAASLGMISDALGNMGKMSWESIAKGLVMLAGSLGIIAAAMALMPEALPGAAALLIVAASLRILLPVLQGFGSMSWESIAKGLVMLAGAFAVIGIASAILGPILGPLIPVFLGIGAAAVMIGIGALAAGLGVMALAAGITALAAVSATGSAALSLMVYTMLSLIPMAMEQFALGIVAFINVIANRGPEIVRALVVVLGSLIDAIVQVTPKIITALITMLSMMLNKLAEYTPQMVSAGFKILIGFLTGVRDNIGKVTELAIQIVVNFINAIANQLPAVADAGAKLIVSFVNSVANAIRNNSDAMNRAGRNLGSAIVEGMVSGISGGISAVTGAARRLAQNALDSAMNALGVHSPSREFAKIGMYSAQGLAIGLTDYSRVSEKAAANLGKDTILAFSKTIAGISDLIPSEMDVTPTITPVLDLSNVKRDSALVRTMLATKPITVDTTYLSAKDASAGYSSNKAVNEANAASTGDTITKQTVFNQYNTSPKAISEAELYRQTNNIISRAKGE